MGQWGSRRTHDADGGFQRDASDHDTGGRTSLLTKSSPSDGVAARASALQPTHTHATHSRGGNDTRHVRRPGPTRSTHVQESRGCADAEADMPSAEASGAGCVQNFDGSRNSAIHTTYRISLRSSSIREPRYPLLRVVLGSTQDRSRSLHFSFSTGHRTCHPTRARRHHTKTAARPCREWGVNIWTTGRTTSARPRPTTCDWL